MNPIVMYTIIDQTQRYRQIHSKTPIEKLCKQVQASFIYSIIFTKILYFNIREHYFNDSINKQVISIISKINKHELCLFPKALILLFTTFSPPHLTPPLPQSHLLCPSNVGRGAFYSIHQANRNCTGHSLLGALLQRATWPYHFLHGSIALFLPYGGQKAIFSMRT